MLRNTNLKIHVKKTTLIEELTKNRNAHVADYNQALEIYFSQLRTRLTSLLSNAEESRLLEDGYSIGLQQPQLKEDEYNKYIQMLEISTDDIIEITTSEYDQIVNDNWDWIASAKQLNSTYLAMR